MGYIIFALITVFAIWLLWRNEQKSSNSKIGNRPNLAVLPRKFVVFDIETTGLSAEKHEIIEIGAIRVDLDHPESTPETLKTDTYSALIKPTRKVPEKITKLTGITQKELDAKGRRKDEVLGEFYTFVGELPLVAYNADFDVSFLQASSGSKLNNRVSCALKMTKQAWPGLKSYRLEEISSKMGLKTNDSHRAIGDAQRALVVYLHAASALNRATH